MLDAPLELIRFKTNLIGNMLPWHNSGEPNDEELEFQNFLIKNCKSMHDILGLSKLKSSSSYLGQRILVSSVQLSLKHESKGHVHNR